MATGWASAGLEPINMIDLLLCMSFRLLVMAP